MFTFMANVVGMVGSSQPFSDLSLCVVFLEFLNDWKIIFSRYSESFLLFVREKFRFIKLDPNRVRSGKNRYFPCHIIMKDAIYRQKIHHKL